MTDETASRSAIEDTKEPRSARVQQELIRALDALLNDFGPSSGESRTSVPVRAGGATLTRKEKDAIREAIGFRLSGETDDVDRAALERALGKL